MDQKGKKEVVGLKHIFCTKENWIFMFLNESIRNAKQSTTSTECPHATLVKEVQHQYEKSLKIVKREMLGKY